MQTFLAAAALTVLAGSASAAVVQPLLFSVYTESGSTTCCETVPDETFVTSFYNDSIAHAFAEFNLAGAQLATAPVYLSFEVDSIYNPGLLTGSIVVDAYGGNNRADISDVRESRIGIDPIGSFEFPTIAAGSVLRFDVTNVYNFAVSLNKPALGIRITGAGGAFTSRQVISSESFSNVALSDIPVVAAVPEASTACLLLAGLLPLAVRRRSTTAP